MIKDGKLDLLTCLVCGLIGFCLFLPTMVLVNYYSHPYLIGNSSEPVVMPPTEIDQGPSPDQVMIVQESSPIDFKLIEIYEVGRLAAIADGCVYISYDEFGDSPYVISIPIEKFTMEELIDDNLSVVALRMQFSDFNPDLSLQQNIDVYLEYAHPTIMDNQV